MGPGFTPGRGAMPKRRGCVAIGFFCHEGRIDELNMLQKAQ